MCFLFQHLLLIVWTSAQQVPAWDQLKLSSSNTAGPVPSIFCSAGKVNPGGPRQHCRPCPRMLSSVAAPCSCRFFSPWMINVDLGSLQQAMHCIWATQTNSWLSSSGCATSGVQIYEFNTPLLCPHASLLQILYLNRSRCVDGSLGCSWMSISVASQVAKLMLPCCEAYWDLKQPLCWQISVFVSSFTVVCNFKAACRRFAPSHVYDDAGCREYHP